MIIPGLNAYSIPLLDNISEKIIQHVPIAQIWKQTSRLLLPQPPTLLENYIHGGPISFTFLLCIAFPRLQNLLFS